MLMRTESVPEGETSMSSLLPKSIHFAAKDCGYSGTRHYLIAGWIHPLSLKAKLGEGKEDNPS